MKLNAFRWLSLKTRVALFTLVIFVISIGSLAFYATRILREDMQKQLGEQLFSTATFAAAQVNEELEDRFRVLGKSAADITPAMLGNTPMLQRSLGQSALLPILFNGGVLATGPDGIAVADVPMSAGRTGRNYMENKSISAALKEGRSTIGRPIMGEASHAPIFSMAVPIRDPKGKVIGALAGVVNLGAPNFLDKITQGRYGRAGAYLLNAPQYRVIVTASDKSRIMQPLPLPGVNPMLDRYIQGFEGYGFAVDSRGVEMLNSAKGIPAAGWFISVVLPTEEAFAPIRNTLRHIAVSTLFLALLASGLIWCLMWWMLRRQLSPMIAATEALDTYSRKSHVPQPLPVTNRDEIGALIGGFNRLLETLRQRDRELRTREGRFRTLIEWTPEPMVVHRDGKLLYANPAAIELFGASSAQDLTGKPILDLVHPDFHHISLGRAREVIQSRTSLPMIEENLLKWDGTVITAEVQNTVIDYDGAPAVLVSVRDVTQRKHAESALREREARYRAIVETSLDGFWVVDTNGRILEVNDPYLQRSGYTREELLRLSLFDIDATRTREQIQATLEKGGVRIDEAWHRAKDGSVWPLEVSSVRVPTEPGRRYAFLRDITERKRVEEELRRGAERLTAVMSQLTTVEEQERRDIAIDLHDDLSQLLAAANMRMRSLPKPKDSAEYHQALGEVAQLAAQAERSARSLSFQISPPLLFDLGLVPALEALADELQKVHRLTVSVHDDGRPKGLTMTARSVLYRATRELLINVAKHARVGFADVDVRVDEHLLVISVTDRGVGFDKALLEKRAPGRGFGLVSLRERLQLIGGSFDIDTHPGDGTVATLVLSLAAAASR